jgi:hypothetical protein
MHLGDGRNLSNVKYSKHGQHSQLSSTGLTTPTILTTPKHVPRLGQYLLIVNPIIDPVRLTKVLMDRGSGLNILYSSTFHSMGINRDCLWPSGGPYHGVMPGRQDMPLRRIDLPVTFGVPSSFSMETLTFEVVGFHGTYHTILGRPCYVKFMVVPNYTYLKLMILGHRGVITIGMMAQHIYVCEVECYNLAEGVAMTQELSHMLQIVSGEAPDAKRGNRDLQDHRM